MCRLYSSNQNIFLFPTLQWNILHVEIVEKFMLKEFEPFCIKQKSLFLSFQKD